MATSTTAAVANPGGTRPHIAVIGAGAWGGWTALGLLRRGARVTLLDAWGPGNSRASSGGETRVIRATYGPDRPYVDLVIRSLRLWRENEVRWGQPLYRRTGGLWMAERDDRYERAALPLVRDAGLVAEELTTSAAARRYPQINFSGVDWVIHEPEAGFLFARRACAAVLTGFLQEGGDYLQAAVTLGAIVGGAMRPVVTTGGTTLAADQYVFAAGAWLGKLFPDVIGERVRPTRQEVHFFGTPAGDSRFLPEQLPVWIDHGARVMYGIPGNDRRGFKVADDTRGDLFDPTDGDRLPSPERVQAARDYLGFRFPGLRGAPLLEARVCPYENTADGRFIIDRHPGAANAWLIGGGSGHGFKHGPAIGERVADLVLGGGPVDRFFALERFAAGC